MLKAKSIFPNNKIISILLILALLISVAATASAAPGTSEDPVISKQYLEGTYLPSLLSELRSKTDGGLSEAYAENLFEISQLVAAYNMEADLSNTASRQGFGSVRFKKGDIITLAAGTTVTVEKNETVRALDSRLVNVTTGDRADGGDWLRLSESYMASEYGAEISVVTPTTQMVITGEYTLTVSTSPNYNATADALNALGLFKGDSTGYNLERAANRTEGLVMFIRLLGEENEALSYNGTHPFSDVPSWADKYVAYAYQKGYTNGVSVDRFGADNTLALRDYVTFVMRALKYTEGVDFSWASAGQDAVRVGIISSAELNAMESEGFLRAHVAYLSYYALYSRIQSGGLMLMVSLEQEGVISSSQVVSSLLCLNGPRIS